MEAITLLEKAAKVLEYHSENIDLNNIGSLHVSQAGKKLIYKNEELHQLASLVYRLLHAGLTHNKSDGCSHPEWEDEVNKMYRELTGNGDVPKT